MRNRSYIIPSIWFAAFIIFACFGGGLTSGQTHAVKSVEIISSQSEYEVGQHVKFSAVARDESGNAIGEKPAGWSAHPFDLAAIDEDGTASFYQPGEVIIGVEQEAGLESGLVRLEWEEVNRV